MGSGSQEFQPGNGLDRGAGNGSFQRRGSIMKLLQSIQQFAREEDGVTAIEYGLIAALIAVTIIISVTSVGDNLVLVFDAVAAALAGAI
jgi:pilus assembly protein Flp/PilA